MRKLLVLIAGILFMSSCYNKNELPEADMPDNLIARDTIVMILVDVEIAEAALRHRQNFGYEIGDEKEAYFRAIFKKYGITKEIYDNSLAYYKNDLETMNLIYEDVITQLSLMQSETQME